MKAFFEKVQVSEENTLLVKHLKTPYFNAPLHFHPEFELTFILQGYGQRFVGDSIENFGMDDLVLLGPNLPHYWRCDQDFYLGQSGLIAEAIVCQFSEQVLPVFFQQIPEFIHLSKLLNSAKYGVKFGDSVAKILKSSFYELSVLEGAEKILKWMILLNKISQSTDYQLLTNDNLHYKVSQAETERMKKILDYTLQHFTEEISLSQIAEVAHLTLPAFCRYFKQRTRKSYFDYLNELRLNHARKLLINSDLPISQIAFESGYQNISHFHSQFKKSFHTSPLVYRKRFRG